MSSFTNVTVETKANIYFDGQVVSHSVFFDDGSKKTLGLIYPGKYHFGTAAPECMEITSGTCEVTLDGTKELLTYEAGSYFDIAGNHGFTICVKEGICQYICSFLSA